MPQAARWDGSVPDQGAREETGEEGTDQSYAQQGYPI